MEVSLLSTEPRDSPDALQPQSERAASKAPSRGALPGSPRKVLLTGGCQGQAEPQTPGWSGQKEWRGGVGGQGAPGEGTGGHDCTADGSGGSMADALIKTQQLSPRKGDFSLWELHLNKRQGGATNDAFSLPGSSLASP